jgi:hypothetical protein
MEMITTEHFTTESIRELAKAAGPCITIALQGTAGGGTAVAFKGAINTVRKELQSRGITGGELLEPLTNGNAQSMVETKPGEGVVILRSPSVMQIHKVAAVQPVVTVDDHFAVRTLLSLAAGQTSFYILALSQRRTRILKCDSAQFEEIPFPDGFPTSLAEAMQTRKPDHDLENRSNGGPSMGGGAVLFGTSSDRDGKDEYLIHFFRSVDRAVHNILSNSADPLIAVGVEHEIALYRRVNSYARLMEAGVHGAPDGLEGGEMHKRALQLLREREAQPPVELADFDKRVGTGHASIHAQEIVAAAYEGRVSHLFLQAGAQYLGTYDAVRQRVKRTDDPLDSPVDLIETAARQTMQHGGEVAILPAPAMPGGVPVCALFRYPAPASGQ